MLVSSTEKEHAILKIAYTCTHQLLLLHVLNDKLYMLGKKKKKNKQLVPQSASWRLHTSRDFEASLMKIENKIFCEGGRGQKLHLLLVEQL